MVANEKGGSKTQLLMDLDYALKNAKENFSNLDDSQSLIGEEIKAINEQAVSLKGQLDYIEILGAQSKKKILAIKKQIAEIKNQILTLKEREGTQSGYRDELRELMQSLVSELYIQYRFTTDVGKNLDSSKLLLASVASSDILQFESGLVAIAEVAESAARRLEAIDSGISDTREVIAKKEKTLALLEKRVRAEQENILAHKLSKEVLLAETKGKESTYQRLLAETIREQDEVLQQIERLKDNKKFIEEKLDAVDIENYQKTIALDTSTVSRATPLNWPVTPTLGLSAYFQDEEYLNTIGIPHEAIDIPVLHGSSVRASRSGIVSKVNLPKDKKGYAYVMLSHKESFVTLYGHMSDIFVEEGETVYTGQVIGLSGGTPGTDGAGWLTTGAHLHFEVFKDWKHVDPLAYLPIEYLPLEYVPEKYLERAQSLTRKVKR